MAQTTADFCRKEIVDIPTQHAVKRKGLSGFEIALQFEERRFSVSNDNSRTGVVPRSGRPFRGLAEVRRKLHPFVQDEAI